jgi:uncharacterized membrane protein YidH (DUF202 family)
MALDGTSAPPFAQRVLIYALAVVAGVAAALAGVRWLGFRGEEMLFLEGGVLFLVAGSGRTPRLFGAVRRAGWFGAVPNDQVMRGILLIIGAVTVLAVLLRRALFPTA